MAKTSRVRSPAGTSLPPRRATPRTTVTESGGNHSSDTHSGSAITGRYVTPAPRRGTPAPRSSNGADQIVVLGRRNWPSTTIEHPMPPRYARPEHHRVENVRCSLIVRDVRRPLRTEGIMYQIQQLADLSTRITAWPRDTTPRYYPRHDTMSFGPRPTAAELAEELFRDAEFRALGLGGWLGTDRGQPSPRPSKWSHRHSFEAMNGSSKRRSRWPSQSSPPGSGGPAAWPWEPSQPSSVSSV